MKRKQMIKCKHCNGNGVIAPEDEGPFYIYCDGCGRETLNWALEKEAWSNWKRMNNVFVKDSGMVMPKGVLKV